MTENNQPTMAEHCIIQPSEEMKKLIQSRESYCVDAEISTAALKEILNNQNYCNREVIKKAVSNLNTAIQMIDYYDERIAEQEKIDRENFASEKQKQESKEILGIGGKN